MGEAAMNIDWSKAPEGATHYAGGFWYGIVHDSAWRYWPEESEWRKSVYSAEDVRSKSLFCARPDPATWNGEGLPPVGIRCIFDGEEGEIVAHVRGDFPLAIIQFSKGWEAGQADDFKPIRTPEQIAAEERDREVAKMLEVADIENSAFHICLSLYNAGYRKTEG